MSTDKLRMTFARALFDNVAEMPRELSFKKGDILTVLQERYENNPEWWVCSLRNVVGLAPANRLEAMPVLMANKPAVQRQPSSSTYDDLPEQPLVHQTKHNIFPEKKNTPYNVDETYSTYQLPKEDLYVNQNTDNTTEEQSVYQIPSENFDETYSNIQTDSPSTSLVNTLQNNTIRPLKEHLSSEYHNNRSDYSDSFSDATSTSYTNSSIHSAPQFSQTSSDSGDFRSIPKDATGQLLLTQEEGIARSRNLQNEVTGSCNKVIEFVNAKWKSEEMLKSTMNSIQETFNEFSRNLNLLISFATAVYQNSLECPDVNLRKKLCKHVSLLQESQQTVKDALEKLDRMNWDPVKVATSVRLAVREGADALGPVVASARNILINIRSLSVTINGNSSILFPGKSTSPSEDSDGNHSNGTIVTKDKNEDNTCVEDVLKLFGQQVQCQVELVNETVNDFISFLSNRPPETHFQETVSMNSKFVVRSATQLVCIAKNLSDTQIEAVQCQKIEEAGNNLCDCLKIMITVTKEFIAGKIWSSDQKDRLLRQLRLVNSSAKKVQLLVDSLVS